MKFETYHNGGVKWILLNNPPVNALCSGMLEQLLIELEKAKYDDNVRVLVLGAKGRHFCAGVDLREQYDAWQTGVEGAAEMGATLYQMLLDYPKPLIGMVQGAVVGAGLSIIACCDLVVAEKGTKISLPEIDVGILGGISHSKRVLGKSTVNYLALTGKPIDIERVQHMGLVFDVVEPAFLKSTTTSIALCIAAKSPEALLYTKRCMKAVEDVNQLEGYIKENELSGELRSTGVTRQLVAQFLRKA